MLQSLAKYFSTRNQIICILFFTYIYDLVRAGFIESRKKQLETLNRKGSNCQDTRHLSRRGGSPQAKGGLSPYMRHDASSGGFAGSSKSPRLGPRPSQVAHLFDLDTSDPIDLISANMCHDLNALNERTDYRASFVPRLKRGDFSGVSHFGTRENWIPYTYQLCSPGLMQARQQEYVFFRESPTPYSPAHSTSSSSNGSEHLRQRRVTASSSPEADDELGSSLGGDSEDSSEECPLDEMPKLIRRYQYLSHSLVILSFIKYTFLLIFEFELLGSKRTFSCYLPGRTAILPQLSPVFSWMVLSYHVIYRFYLCVLRKTFNLDCFIFLLYDRQSIEDIQRNKLTRLAQSNDPVEISRIYAMNRLFFVKVYLRDEGHRVIYRMKSNRNLEHWIKVKQFFNRFVLFAIGNIALWSIPLTIAIVMTVLSIDNFDILYGSCDEVVKRHKSNWSNYDLRQLLWFLCDMIDSGWLLFDTSQALVWPFTSMVFCSQDLNFTIDKLTSITNDIASRLRLALDIANAKYWPEQIQAIKNRRLRKLFESLEVEILIVQTEIARMLQQVHQVDEFMSKISAFCIVCWICSNLMVQIISMNRNKLVMLDTVIQFMQITGLIGLTFTFAYIAQVNTKTRRLYRVMSNLVALDPSPKTKESWQWVLEYFNRSRPSYSLRLGPFIELTLANYIKAISWLITGAVIIVNLSKYK